MTIQTNPMHPSTCSLQRDVFRLNQAQRCLAKTRGAKPCKSPAVKGKCRCRMHGGAANSGAPLGKRNGAYRSGAFTREAIADRQMISALVAECRALAKSLR